MDVGYESNEPNSNIVLAHTQDQRTIFNNRSYGTEFVIKESGASNGNFNGFHYNTESGVLGLNVNDATDVVREGTANSPTPWYDRTNDQETMVMYANGKIRVEGLQMGGGGGTFNSTAKDLFLTVVDEYGNIGFATPSVDQNFQVRFPLAINGQTSQDVTMYEISEDDEDGNSLTTNQRGMALIWEGTRWVQGASNVGYCTRLGIPSASTPDNYYTSEGSSFGPYATLPSGQQNSFVIAGQPIVAETARRANSGHSRSMQQETTILKAIAGGTSTEELTTNFTKGSTGNGATGTNTISLIVNPEVSDDTAQHQIAWRVEIDYVVMTQKDGGGNNLYDLAATVGKYTAGVRIFSSGSGRGAGSIFGAVFDTKYDGGGPSNIFGGSDPITVSIDSTATPPRLSVKAVPPGGGYTSIYEAVVKLTQMQVPKGMPFTGSDPN